METVIQNTITNHKIMLDQHCKAIVGNQEMLARMIHEFVREARHLSVKEIMKIIKDEQRFRWLNNENMIPNYGTVKFDMLCCVDLPQLNGTNKRIYLNVEIQNNIHPGYSLVTRGIASVLRILTTQLGREYDDKISAGVHLNDALPLFTLNIYYFVLICSKFSGSFLVFYNCFI